MQIKMEIYIFGIPPLNLIMIVLVVLVIWTVRVAIRNIELDTDIDRLNRKASTQQVTEIELHSQIDTLKRQACTQQEEHRRQIEENRVTEIELHSQIDTLKRQARTEQEEHSRQIEEIEDALETSRYLRRSLGDELTAKHHALENTIAEKTRVVNVFQDQLNALTLSIQNVRIELNNKNLELDHANNVLFQLRQGLV